jgi:NADPH:quinone reductase-like Zn-dependent oxidoreductase
MKAAVVRGAGVAPVHGEFADPVAGEGEHRVTVSASALSPLTKARASGTHYSSAGGFPFVAGIDGVGRLDDGTRVYFVLPTRPMPLADVAAGWSAGDAERIVFTIG